MKFKKGDFVVVKKDLIAGKVYGTNTFVNNMEKYLGKTLKVKNLANTERGYFLEGGEGWIFTEKMLKQPKNNIQKLR